MMSDSFLLCIGGPYDGERVKFCTEIFYINTTPIGFQYKYQRPIYISENCRKYYRHEELYWGDKLYNVYVFEDIEPEDILSILLEGHTNDD